MSPRVPVPTRITNVVATLHGTDPTAADRVYVVGGHYDSRVTDVMPRAPVHSRVITAQLGVRAIDREGNRSPVAATVPAAG